MERQLPMSHCKFCKEEAQNCECAIEANRLLRERVQDILNKHFYEWIPKGTIDFSFYTVADEIVAKSIAACNREWVEWIKKHSSRMNTNMYGISISKEAWQERQENLGGIQ